MAQDNSSSPTVAQRCWEVGCPCLEPPLGILGSLLSPLHPQSFLNPFQFLDHHATLPSPEVLCRCLPLLFGRIHSTLFTWCWVNICWMNTWIGVNEPTQTLHFNHSRPRFTELQNHELRVFYFGHFRILMEESNCCKWHESALDEGEQFFSTFLILLDLLNLKTQKPVGVPLWLWPLALWAHLSVAKGRWWTLPTGEPWPEDGKP